MGGVPDTEAELPPVLMEALARIRTDREHGASWLAREAARALAEATAPEQPHIPLALLQRGAQALAQSRPSMAALGNTVARIWAMGSSQHDTSSTERRSAMHTAATNLLNAWETAAGAIEKQVRPLIRGPIYTHSRSGTVEAVLRAIAHEHSSGTRLEAVVAESRPGGEGIAAARALAAAGWQVTLVPDTASGLFLRDVADVVVGADSVRQDGSVVNKVGTYPLALMAHAQGIPVYVLCETLKIAPPALPLQLEEMDPKELLGESLPNLRARNVYFDVTPADVITSVVTEVGILSPAAIAARAEEAGRAHHALYVSDAC